MRRGTAAALAAVTHVIGVLGDVIFVPYAVASSSFASTAFALALNASDKSCALLLGNASTDDVLASATLIAIAVLRRTMEDTMYHGIGRALGVDALRLSSSSSSAQSSSQSSRKRATTTTTLIGALLWPTTASCILCGAACAGTPTTPLTTVALLIALTTCVRVLAFAFVGEALVARARAFFQNQTGSDSDAFPLAILAACSAVFAVVPLLFAFPRLWRRPPSVRRRRKTR
jgi:hypothetical protein